MDARFVEQVDEQKRMTEFDMTTTTQAISAGTRSSAMSPVLIAGGTGKTGRRVAARLQDLGVPLRIGSRSSDPPFDWERPDGWAAALQGATAVYAAYAPDLAVPGAVQAIEQLVELAEHGGIEKFVLLTGRGEDEAQAAEAVVQRSSLDWTIVRCAWFMQNFSEYYLIDGVPVTRPSNVVSDAVPGVTFTLSAADPDATATVVVTRASAKQEYTVPTEGRNGASVAADRRQMAW